jgi:ATPase subunit of ABC transporter with duplicated ATPase domains
LTPSQRLKTAVEIVVDADLERTLLLDELVTLDKLAAEGELDTLGSKRHGEVLSRLDEIGADSASRRAEILLETLGFSKAFLQRPLSQLSGGWYVTQRWRLSTADFSCFAILTSRTIILKLARL